MFGPDHPLIVQGDGSILLDAHHARADEARAAIGPYAEVVSAPEHVHTYRHLKARDEQHHGHCTIVLDRILAIGSHD